MRRSPYLQLVWSLTLACGSSGLPAIEPGADGAPIITPPSEEQRTTPVPPAAACDVGAASDALTVATTRGLVRGSAEDGIVSFRGIRFAMPPLGQLRFREPQPPACATSVVDATQYGNACPQNVVGVVQGDEDCLFLNVWTPARSDQPSKKRPVVFWIHGGANVEGVSHAAAPTLGVGLYEGKELARREDVVVVSANYRLGALGFLAHPALGNGDHGGASGNYGLLDQIAALRWIKDNIAAFGGDPERVMVFGESAGAFDTCALLASPLAAGLFSSALMQSGVCEQPARAFREKQGAAFVSKVGCDKGTDVAGCLRDKPAADLVVPTLTLDAILPVDVKNAMALSFGPTVDGWVLPSSPLDALRAGTHNHVPFAIGSNSEEAALFIQPGQVLTCVDYTALLALAFGADANIVHAQYPCLSYLTAHAAVVDLFTDLDFTCPARRAARAAAATNGLPVWRYRFTHGLLVSSTTSWRGATHASDIPFVFGTFAAFGALPTPAETSLSRTMQGYWASFARSGNPNGSGRPAWPAYVASEDVAIVLDTTISTENAIKASRCDFWDKLAAQ